MFHSETGVHSAAAPHQHQADHRRIREESRETGRHGGLRLLIFHRPLHGIFGELGAGRQIEFLLIYSRCVSMVLGADLQFDGNLSTASKPWPISSKTRVLSSQTIDRRTAEIGPVTNARCTTSSVMFGLRQFARQTVRTA